MDENEDLESDTSDDDYLPEAESDDEVVSDCPEDSADEDELTSKRRTSSAKRKKNGNGLVARKKLIGAIRLEDDNGESKDKSMDEDGEQSDAAVCKDVAAVAFAVATDEDNKKRADDLWSSFKKDVETTTTTTIKPKSPDSKSPVATSSPKTQRTLKNSEPITVTKVYDFAGEEIRVTEKLEDGVNRPVKQVVAVQPDRLTSTTPTEPSPGGTKKPAGLGNILNKLGAKKKLSTLEKSRLDWNQFKHQEGIGEELSTFNRGKEGYLEKQAFLQRADLRQFEIERNLRMTNRSNR